MPRAQEQLLGILSQLVETRSSIAALHNALQQQQVGCLYLDNLVPG